MIIIKCNNKACQHTFRIEDRLEKGGINDPCILEVECPECNALTYIPSYNFCRKAFIDGGKVKKVIEGRLHEHPELPYPEMLTAPEGVELKESKVRWSIKGYNLWRSTSHEFEMQATCLLYRNKSYVTERMRSYINCYLKGNGPSVAFYIQDYKLGKFKAQAVWAKDIKSETDLNTKDYYLVHHSRVCLEKQIDGLYTRNEAKVILERLLMRWKFLGNQVVIATPFIGFDYVNRRADVRKLWDWLDSLVDMSKTKFLTRKCTYKLLKESYNTSMVDTSTRCEWQLLDQLTNEAEKVVNIKRVKKILDLLDNAPVSFFQQFHAKFYAGIFDNHVEVLVGSYNIHTGKYYDNLMFKRYTKEQFLELYMHKLCPRFRYSDVKHPSVLVTHISYDKNSTCTTASFNNLLETINIKKI